MLPPACQAGGRKRRASEPTSGSQGASTPANVATKPMLTRIITGRSGKPSSPRTRSAREERGTASERIAMASGLQPNAWIDHGVKDIDQKIDDYDHGPSEQHHGLHHREIAERDALIEQASDTGAGKKRFPHNAHITQDEK